MNPMLVPNDHEADRKRIIRGRNRAVALLLLGMVVLFFFITIVQFGD